MSGRAATDSAITSAFTSGDVAANTDIDAGHACFIACGEQALPMLPGVSKGIHPPGAIDPSRRVREREDPV